MHCLETSAAVRVLLGARAGHMGVCRSAVTPANRDPSLPPLAHLAFSPGPSCCEPLPLL